MYVSVVVHKWMEKTLHIDKKNLRNVLVKMPVLEILKTKIEKKSGQLLQDVRKNVGIV